MTKDGYSFLWYVKDPENARTDNMDDLKELIKSCQSKGVAFYMLSSANKEITMNFLNEHGIQGIEVLVLDGTVSKTALRSNPGLMLLKKGVIQGKWSFRDYPDARCYSITHLSIFKGVSFLIKTYSI